MFNHVNAVVLLVNDFEASLAFYRDKVGLTVVQQEEKFAAFKMHNQDFAILHISDAAPMVNAEISEKPAHGVGRILLCADVEDVNAAYAAMGDRGVVFTQPPVDQAWGYRTVYFADPESNIWEFRQTIKS